MVHSMPYTLVEAAAPCGVNKSAEAVPRHALPDGAYALWILCAGRPRPSKSIGAASARYFRPLGSLTARQHKTESTAVSESKEVASRLLAGLARFRRGG